MSRVFHVGELVIMQRATRHTQYNGFPAIVVGGLASRRAFDINRRAWVELPRSYEVRVLAPGGPQHIAEPYQLRRLRDGDQQETRKRQAHRRSKLAATI